MASPTELLDQLLALSIMLQKDMTTKLGQDGLTVARTHLVWELHHRGPVTQQTLAAALEVTPRNVTSLVDALVASGHVSRDPHPDDRRAFLITLTERGARSAAAMAEDHQQLARDLFATVPGDDLAATGRVLDRAQHRLAELIEDDLRKAEDQKRKGVRP